MNQSHFHICKKKKLFNSEWLISGNNKKTLAVAVLPKPHNNAQLYFFGKWFCYLLILQWVHNMIKAFLFVYCKQKKTANCSLMEKIHLLFNLLTKITPIISCHTWSQLEDARFKIWQCNNCINQIKTTQENVDNLII